jgi:hypothetical protein
MQKIIKVSVYIFMVVFLLTAILILLALSKVWFFSSHDAQLQDLPYLGWLLGIVIAEAVGVVILFAKKGLKYLPEIEVNKTERETLEFMRRFIDSGSSVTIVSNRVAWLNKSNPIKLAITNMAKNGTRLEIITPSAVAEDIKTPLAEAGVSFYVTGEDTPPEARFTLVNGHRSGAEKLAIARGGHPEHEITIFDNNSGPQIVAMAKDIIRKSKELSRAH